MLGLIFKIVTSIVMKGVCIHCDYLTQAWCNSHTLKRLSSKGFFSLTMNTISIDQILKFINYCDFYLPAIPKKFLLVLLMDFRRIFFRNNWHWSDHTRKKKANLNIFCRLLAPLAYGFRLEIRQGRAKRRV